MAKTSSIQKNEKRKLLVERYRERRAELKRILKDPKVAPEEKTLALRRLTKQPRDASAVRVRNRCALTGRSRGYYRKFGLSRIAVRDLALRGELPGVIKASW